jgi:hypothetical protein
MTIDPLARADAGSALETAGALGGATSGIGSPFFLLRRTSQRPAIPNTSAAAPTIATK